MTRKIPDYLKLHLEESALTSPKLKDFQGLDAVCQSFNDVTGWKLGYTLEPDLAANAQWSMTVDTEDEESGRLFLSREAADGEALPMEKARLIAEAIGTLVAEIYRTQRAVWQREAELAAGIPVTLRADEQRQLATRLQSVLRGGAEAIGCQAAALYLLNDATSHLKLRACWQLPKARFLDPAQPLRGAVADLEALVGHAVALEDTSLLPHWKTPEDFPAALCVPVSTSSTPLGTLWFFATHVREFGAEQTHLAEIIAGRLVSDLEREVLVREGLRQRQSDQARQLLAHWQDEQRPRLPPLIDGWQVAGRTGRTESLGGQMYDWCVLPDGQIAVTLGHAEGHTIEASLTATTLQIALKSHAAYRHDARQMLDRLNEALWTHSTGNRFASLYYALIDPEAGDVCAASAGEMHALIYGPQNSESMTEPAPLLGLDPDTQFHQQSRSIHIGASLILFTRPGHGLLDVESREPEEARVVAALRELDRATAEEQVDAVMQELVAHSAHDRTVVAVKRIF